MLLLSWLSRLASSDLRRRTRRRRQNSDAAPFVETLERRILLTNDTWAPTETLPLSGAAEDTLHVHFELADRDADFANEIGVFVADNPLGRVNGVAPTDPEFVRTVLEDPDSAVVFPRGTAPGATFEWTVSGGQHLGLFLIQNGTVEDIQNTPANGLPPVAFFSVVAANSDGFDHVRTRTLGENHWQLGWEDLTGGGDQDFDDAVLEVSAHVAKRGALKVPGEAADTVPTRITLLEREAAYKNTLGLFRVDNVTGHINGLSPGAPGYADAVFAEPERYVVFSGKPSAGAVWEVGLEGGSYWGLFLIQNATTEKLLERNPHNLLGRSPRAFFLFPEANPDHFDHVSSRPGNIYAWEDLTRGGDRDFDDMVVQVEFLEPEREDLPPTVTILAPDEGLITNENPEIVARVADDHDDISAVTVQIGNRPAFAVDVGEDGDVRFVTDLPLDGSADGLHTVELFATDDRGQRSETARVSFTLDTTPPPLSLALAPESDTAPLGDARTTFARVTLVGQTEPNVTVELESTGRTVVADATGMFAFGDVPLQLGENAFQAHVQDAVGNARAVEVTVTRDAAPENQEPEWLPLNNLVVNEHNLATVTLAATDSDAQPGELLFFLDDGPAGADVERETGVFTWTPTEAQGPSVRTITVRVEDAHGASDTASFQVTVNEVSEPPVLSAISSQTVTEGMPLTFTVTATDPDLPANELTFSLVSGVPEGAEIDAETGVFTWTPNEAQGPAVEMITVRVEDEAGAAGTASFVVMVIEENQAPVLSALSGRMVNEGELVTFTASATDADLPSNALTFQLGEDAPAGATVDPQTGAFQWTPTEAQGPNAYTVTVRVEDGHGGSDTETLTITVNEVNQPPVLPQIANQSVDEGLLLSFAIEATDADLPANRLSYSLGAGAPAGAHIDSTTGIFTWTPTEAHGPGEHSITVHVTDNGTSPLSDSVTFTITVNEVNQPPELAPISDQVIAEGELLTLTALAADSDTPPNQLSFSLDPGAPEGAVIDPETGVFTWTPTTPDILTRFEVTVRVTDNGNPSLADTETFAIDVHALLTEGESFAVTREIAFSVPAEPSELAFTFADLNFDRSDQGFIKDAFEVAFLDAQGRPLLFPINEDRDAFFNITEGLAPALGPAVRMIDSTTFAADLSDVAPGTVGTLVFRLVNNDDDTGTSVRITDARIETIASFVGPMPAQSAGPVDDSTTNPLQAAAALAANQSQAAFSSQPADPPAQDAAPLTQAVDAGESVLDADGQITFSTTEDFQSGTFFNVNATDLADQLRLNSAGQLEQFGTWTTIIDAQRPAAQWVTAEAIVDTPEATSVRLRARAADTEAALESLAWQSIAFGEPLTNVQGRFLEVQLVLESTDPAVTPTVSELIVQAAAPPIVTIGQPADGIEVPVGSIVLSGFAGASLPGLPDQRQFPNRISYVTINGRPVDVLDPAGNFFSRIDVLPGRNDFAISAVDIYGQSSTVSLSVNGVQSAPGEIDFRRFTDMTANFSGVYFRTSFNEDTDTLFVDLATQNDGRFIANTPLLVAVDHLSDPSVAVLDPDGITPEGLPFYDFTDLVPGGRLAPGELSQAPTIAFRNPGRDRFTYDLIFYGKLNAAPVIASLPNVEAFAGRTYRYDVDATDPDNDPLTYTLLIAPDGMQIDAQTGEITWTPEAAERGIHEVTIHVADGRGGEATQHFSLAVLDPPPNRPPIITSTPVIHAEAGGTPPSGPDDEWAYTYDVESFDPDDDPLEYALTVSPGGMTIDEQTGLIQWTPTAAQIGPNPVTVEISDGRGGVAEQTFVVTVEPDPANHAPVIVSQPITQIIVAEENDATTYVYAVEALDPDEDPLTYSLAISPDGMTIDVETGAIE